MSDQTEDQTPPPLTAGEDSTTTTTIQPSDPNLEETTKNLKNLNTSFSIWPPSQRTRDAVIKRLIQTLSDKSVLSDRYGSVPAEESESVARMIEEEAFNNVNGGSVPEGEDGIEILQSYSKEISKRMLDFVKGRSVVETGNDRGVDVDADVAGGGGEDVEASTVET